MPITKTSILSTIAGVFILIIALAALYTWASLTWSYSKGDRTGYVQKFSSKGWLCKTWEGELTMLPVQGMVPEKFVFRSEMTLLPTASTVQWQKTGPDL